MFSLNTMRCSTGLGRHLRSKLLRGGFVVAKLDAFTSTEIQACHIVPFMCGRASSSSQDSTGHGAAGRQSSAENTVSDSNNQKPVTEKGDCVEARSGKHLEMKGATYFTAGDHGIVTKVLGGSYVQITWKRSNLVTRLSEQDFEDACFVVEKASSNKERTRRGDDYSKGLGPGSPTWDPKKMQFFVGDMVECKRDGKWSTARLAKNHANHHYNVKWDSDATETTVHYDQLRRPENPDSVPFPDWLEDWWPSE